MMEAIAVPLQSPSAEPRPAFDYAAWAAKHAEQQRQDAGNPTQCDGVRMSSCTCAGTVQNLCVHLLTIDYRAVRSARKAPRTLRAPLERIDAGLAFAVLRWSRKHGHSVRPKLTAEQKTQLTECYALMVRSTICQGRMLVWTCFVLSCLLPSQGSCPRVV